MDRIFADGYVCDDIAVQNLEATYQLELCMIRDFNLKFSLNECFPAATWNADWRQSEDLSIIGIEAKRAHYIAAIERVDQLTDSRDVLRIVGLCRGRPELGQSEKHDQRDKQGEQP